MNANQQRLNLTNMAKRTGRISSKQTSIKWINFLNDLKQEIDTNNVYSITAYCRKHNVSNKWVSFLKQNDIIFFHDNYTYEWNDKIPVSKKLIDSYRIFQSKINMKHFPERYKNAKLIKPKKVIKAEPKILREIIKNTNTQEIGLIRKFLKWIY